MNLYKQKGVVIIFISILLEIINLHSILLLPKFTYLVWTLTQDLQASIAFGVCMIPMHPNMLVQYLGYIRLTCI